MQLKTISPRKQFIFGKLHLSWHFLHFLHYRTKDTGGRDRMKSYFPSYFQKIVVDFELFYRSRSFAHLLSFSRFRCSAGGSTFISEPYYREYFGGGDGSAQGYTPSRTIYGDTAEGPSQSAYEGRYTTTHAKSTLVYTKTVTAAGLTVDLPSPDSGIGADAITPRNQNDIQQVNCYAFSCCFFFGSYGLSTGIGKCECPHFRMDL